MREIDRTKLRLTAGISLLKRQEILQTINPEHAKCLNFLSGTDLAYPY
jgi:hypothetical protein